MTEDTFRVISCNFKIKLFQKTIVNAIAKQLYSSFYTLKINLNKLTTTFERGFHFISVKEANIM